MAAWPHAAPPNPAGWAASLGAVLEQYPLGLVEECCDVRTGLAREREFPPTPKAVIDFCERRLKFHRGMVKWGEQQEPEVDRFDEQHQRGMIARLQDLMRGLFKPVPKPVPEFSPKSKIISDDALRAHYTPQEAAE